MTKKVLNLFSGVYINHYNLYDNKSVFFQVEGIGILIGNMNYW